MALQLQHYNKSMPILKKLSLFCQSSFDHPSIILRSSFDWGLEDDYCNFGGTSRGVFNYQILIYHHNILDRSSLTILYTFLCNYLL